MDTTTLERRRCQVVEQMLAIRCMRTGSVSSQFLTVKHKGKAQPVKRGPYFLWQTYRDGKPVRKRLTSAEEVQRYEKEVANGKRFKELCEEFEELTLELGEEESKQNAELEALKKGLKSRSSRAGKSNG